MTISGAVGICFDIFPSASELKLPLAGRVGVASLLNDDTQL
jgi:hypothetical protein